MSSTLKPLFALLAMALGSACVSFIVMVQNDPLTLTQLGYFHQATEIHLSKLESLPVPDATEIGAAISAEIAAIGIEQEVIVPGPLSRPLAARIPARSGSKVVDRLLLPAACRDGEYRMLEEKRGVRLSCPKSSLPALRR